jgi:hypothetical protein
VGRNPHIFLDNSKIIRIFVKHKLSNMKQFKDLLFEEHPGGSLMGVLARQDFDNGYGITVVKGPYTYGGDRGLYEIAVWKDGQIHYDNPVAKGDVVGYLREEDVSDAMLVIQKFK